MYIFKNFEFLSISTIDISILYSIFYFNKNSLTANHSQRSKKKDEINLIRGRLDQKARGVVISLVISLLALLGKL